MSVAECYPDGRTLFVLKPENFASSISQAIVWFGFKSKIKLFVFYLTDTNTLDRRRL